MEYCLECIGSNNSRDLDDACNCRPGFYENSTANSCESKNKI